MLYGEPFVLFDKCYIGLTARISNFIENKSNVLTINLSEEEFTNILLNFSNYLNQYDNILIHDEIGGCSFAFGLLLYLRLSIGTVDNLNTKLITLKDEGYLDKHSYEFATKIVERIDKDTKYLENLVVDKLTVKPETKILDNNSKIISFLIDVSGSTRNLIGQFVKFINKTLDECRSTNTKIYISKFNTLMTRVIDCQDIDTIPIQTVDKYCSGGGTKFFESAHQQINLINCYNETLKLPVTFVMLTDGESLDSTLDYTSDRLIEKIKQCKNNNWEFLYCGPGSAKYKDYCVDILEFDCNSKNVDNLLDIFSNRIVKTAFRFSNPDFIDKCCFFLR